jgi:hypothetical protein
MLDVYSGTVKGYGGFSGWYFPDGAVLVLVLLAVIANAVIKLVRRGWGLTQAELMLVWCMTLVAATAGTAGVHPVLAGAPYMARRPDIYWEEDGALTATPEALVLSKDPKSIAGQQYFEGAGEGRVPWRVWVGPLVRWGAFLMLMYVGVFFMCAILRRQWVEGERLMFPLARIPLEFTEGSPGLGLLPTAFGQTGFLPGLTASVVFRFIRALPLLFGAERPFHDHALRRCVRRDSAGPRGVFQLQPLAHGDRLRLRNRSRVLERVMLLPCALVYSAATWRMHRDPNARTVGA